MKSLTPKAIAAALAIAGIATSTLAACGSSSSTGSTDAPDANVKRSYSSEALASFTTYTGSKAAAADAKSKPVRIGWVNQDSGPGALPELTALVKSAVTLVNQNLDGIGGKPVQLVTCDVNSEETGQSCGQKFANDDSIVAIGQGNVAIGSESFHAAVDPAGIPIIGALPLSPQDAMAPNGFYIASGSFSTIPAMLALLRGPIQGRQVSIITVEGEPISSQVGAQLNQALSAAGVHATQAALPLGSTDATSTLVAAGVDKADVVIPLVILPQQCTAVAQSLTALKSSAKVLTLGACYSSGVKKVLGDYPKWNYLWAYVNPATAVTDPGELAQVKAYKEWAKELDLSQDAVIPLQTVLTIQKHVLAAGGGDATRKTIADAARAWTGPVFLGPPDVKYGSVRTFAPLPALPNLETRAYKYDGDGSFTDITNGDWVG